ncbi:MAG TPA: transcription termination/antitermination protein NusG [Gemmataceae bacterium]|nr:transcription termination/antitermination protein NusG [Gemmataceae bacterium]
MSEENHDEQPAESTDAGPPPDPVGEAPPDHPSGEQPPAESHADGEPHADGAEAELAAAAQPALPETKHWYIVKVQSGREESIKSAIERKIKIEALEEYFGGIKIPMERVSEMRNGKRVVRARKKFPGYLMVNVEFNDRILYLFRETSGVGDFVGGSIHRPPPPMPQHEVDRMLAEEAAAEGKHVSAPQVKLKFDKGDRVKVRDGTFQGMEGEVKEILQPKEAKDPVRVRVELTIFGRGVPVEVEAWQVDPV